MRLYRKESLCEEIYSQADVLHTIDDLSDQQPVSSMGDTPTQTDKMRGAVLDYIRDIEGYRVRLREIHWSAKNNAEHKLTDDLISTFESHEDKVAEVSMGLLGVRIQVGEIVPNIPQAEDLKGLLSSALNSVMHLKCQIVSTPGYAGLESLLDDFSQDIAVGKYLQTLA